MYQHVRGALASAGYAQYEISNFARPGRHARHNQSYWRGIDYLGIGAGAHSYAHTPEWGPALVERAHPERYIAAVGRGDAVAGSETLSFDAAAARVHVSRSPRVARHRPAAFARRFGRDRSRTCTPRWRRFAPTAFSRTADGRVALSERGLLVADSIFAAFL